MRTPGTVRAIHIAPAQGAPMERVDTVRAVAGRGLEGDRYYAPELESSPGETDDRSETTATGTFADRDGSDLTLIEGEVLTAVERDYDVVLEPGDHRRNLTTTGIALNHLVGDRFRLGDVICEGVELCEPCSYLERHLETEGVREALVHRGGLRARIVDGGVVTVGERIERC